MRSSRLLDVESSSESPAVAAARGALVASRGSVALPFEILLRSPELCRRVADVGEEVRFRGRVPARLREVAIVTTAAVLECDFELRHHVPLARQAGVAEATLDLSQHQLHDAPPDESDVVRFCVALLGQHRVDPRTFDAMRRWLDDSQLVELVVIVGYYSLLAGVINVFEPESSPEEEGSRRDERPR
jgi:alkylhydroperoxidase family enzyme